MNKNKLILLIILALTVSIFTIACADGEKENLEVNTTDNIVENEANDDIVDVDDEDEEEDNHTVILGGEEWPTEAMDDIPELNGKIIKATVVTDLRRIEMESVKRKDADNYIEELKAIGFINDPSELINKDRIIFVAKHDDERIINFSWEPDKGSTVDLIYELPFKP